MKKKCVIDIGSNTIKLFISEISDNNELTPIVIKRRMARLGKDIKKTGKLTENSKGTTLRYIEEYINTCKEHGINESNILVSATAACRNASNGKEFINQVKKTFNLVHIKILSGEEEAIATFLGVLKSIKVNECDIYCILDVGGGSFQLSIGNKNKLLFTTSIQEGCNSTAETYNLTQKVSEKEINQAIKYFKSLSFKDLENYKLTKLIGVGGTIKIIQLITRGPENFEPISLEELYSIVKLLAAKTAEERFKWFIKKYPDEIFRNDAGLTIDRAEVLLAGVCIIIGILEKLSIKEILLSHTDAKDYIITLNSFDDILMQTNSWAPRL